MQPFEVLGLDTYMVFVFQENLQKWLTDDKARDQLVIRFGHDTEVYWNDARQKKPEPVHKRSVSYICVSLEQCYMFMLPSSELMMLSSYAVLDRELCAVVSNRYIPCDTSQAGGSCLGWC